MMYDYYLRNCVYNDPKLSSNIDYSGDDDLGHAYDKRVADIDQALRTCVADGGPYEGWEALSLIDQYNQVISAIKAYRDDWINNYAHNQDNDVNSYKRLLSHVLGIPDFFGGESTLHLDPCVILDSCRITANNDWWAEAYKSRNNVSGIIRCAVRTRGSMYYRARDWDDALRMARELVAAWDSGNEEIESTEEYVRRSGFNGDSNYPWDDNSIA